MRAVFQHIETLVLDAALVAGDFAEIGVWHGDTCAPLCRNAHLVGKVCYAVDSFVGMGEPGPRDRSEDGRQQYPAGSLNAGGDAAVDGLRQKCGEAAEALVVFQGWVPEVLGEFQADAAFAFVHVDLDHYQPTVDALAFCWQRMTPGGVLCCHDWFPGRECLASAAFNEFTERIGVRPQGPTPSHHGWVVKGDE